MIQARGLLVPDIRKCKIVVEEIPLSKTVTELGLRDGDVIEVVVSSYPCWQGEIHNVPEISDGFIIIRTNVYMLNSCVE